MSSNRASLPMASSSSAVMRCVIVMVFSWPNSGRRLKATTRQECVALGGLLRRSETRQNQSGLVCDRLHDLGRGKNFVHDADALAGVEDHAFQVAGSAGAGEIVVVAHDGDALAGVPD